YKNPNKDARVVVRPLPRSHHQIRRRSRRLSTRRRRAELREEKEKMGGGMEVHKNRWIEEWNAGRENLEFNFRWARRSLAVVGLFGIAVPILVYKGIVREFHMQDEDAGRPLRKFL
ncbi:unnamed protein product, partial [Urochloa humidicola]